MLAMAFNSSFCVNYVPKDTSFFQDKAQKIFVMYEISSKFILD